MEQNLSEERRRRAAFAVQTLKKRYPQAVCALQYNGDPWRLLVMARLSAQCTDARVNAVSVPLFARFPTCADMAEAPLDELEALVFSCGVYREKAKNLRDCSAMLQAQYGGRVPDTMEALLALPGVGRKIANLMLGDVFGKPAVVADTHCIRISNRLGLVDSKEPEQVERQLRALLPPEESSDFCHRIVLFGREVCTARSPRCADCPFLCEHRKEGSQK